MKKLLFPLSLVLWLLFLVADRALAETNPIYNLRPDGQIQSDMDMGGHAITDGTINWSLLTGIPTASSSVLGLVKVGSGLAIDGSGVLSATGGTGTVTNVGAAGGDAHVTISGSPVTTSGTITIGLANVAETDGSYADPSWITALASSKLTGTVAAAHGGTGQTSLSAMLDAALGTAQGQIAYRNASSWTVLAPGTSGQFLKTQGAAANPVWATVSSGSIASTTSMLKGDGSGGAVAATAGTDFPGLSTANTFRASQTLAASGGAGHYYQDTSATTDLGLWHIYGGNATFRQFIIEVLSDDGTHFEHAITIQRGTGTGASVGVDGIGFPWMNFDSNGFHGAVASDCTATTATAGDSSTKPATTRFVQMTAPLAQCRLSFTSSTSCTLVPYAGNQININGANATIPGSGVALANTGLTAATLYYVYAYLSSGTLTLEASTTGHTLNTSTGFQQKSGDATRTFVGWVYMGAGTPGIFVDTAASRTVVSYFNRLNRNILGASTAAASISSTTYVEVGSSFRVGFIATGEDGFCVSTAGYAAITVGPASFFVGIGLDSATSAGVEAQGTSNSNSFAVGMPAGYSGTPSEGFHYATPLAKANTPSVIVNVALVGTIRG